jgi:probable phosphoglycerate mutase
VLLFGHGHILRVLAVAYLGLPPDQARCLALDVASVSILGHEHWWRAIRVWNSTA